MKKGAFNPWRWIAICALFSLVISCSVGEIHYGDPSIEVAKLKLVSHELGGLQFEECVERNGPESCAILPNQMEFKAGEITVRGDASLVSQFTFEQNRKLQVKTIESGAGLVFCRISTTKECVQCVDSYGGAIVDECGTNINLYSGQTFEDSQGEGTGILVETPAGESSNPDDVTPTNPQDSSIRDFARRIIAEKLNNILEKEGVKFRYTPSENTIQQPNSMGGFFNPSSGFFSSPVKICAMGNNPMDFHGNAWWADLLGSSCSPQAQAQNRCYCWNGPTGNCMVARMTSEVLEEACKEIPQEGDTEAYITAVQEEKNNAQNWLSPGGLWYGLPGTAPNGSDTTVWSETLKPKQPLEEADTPQEITSHGSPLVLDLNGDGVRLTSAKGGVRFDLLGTGPIQTSWVAGPDDALLTIDYNSNGIVDGGGELFGEGSMLGGFYAADGFKALATLDSPQSGGNGDGRVDSADKLFKRLRLWIDHNHDGVSQSVELNTLSEMGVKSLSINGERSGTHKDSYGNDLSLQSDFQKEDGSTGQLIDVYFVSQ